ncbi:hypothetical protein [Sphingobacterium multivorum]|uniref:hypothetical protein n=1 Tax=Sphingobacterium multivorum TaxID=28454 RepID=UPI003DA586A7
MKKQVIWFCLFFALISFISCSKIDLGLGSNGSLKDEEELNNSKANLNSNDIPIIVDPVLNSLELFSGISLPIQQMPSTENDAKTQLSQLRANSLNFLMSDLGLSLSDVISIFGSTDAPDISLVALSFNILETIPKEPGFDICNQQNKYAKCAIEALLPCATISTLYNLTDGAISAGGLMAVWANLPPSVKRNILESIAKYAGKKVTYLGLAWAVYDFATCVLSQNDVPVGQDPQAYTHHRSDSVLNELLTFPEEPISYGYTAYHSHIGKYSGLSSNHVPFPITSVYFDALTGKYYLDAIFNKILPDGFYIEWDYISSNQQIWKYREVKNGQVKLVAFALNDNPLRELEVFDQNTHLPFMIMPSQ